MMRNDVCEAYGTPARTRRVTQTRTSLQPVRGDKTSYLCIDFTQCDWRHGESTEPNDKNGIDADEDGRGGPSLIGQTHRAA